ncbi:DUF4169 family protein [Sphingobium sp. KCTC 72723]|uniref:DUF4169 family protein n=1 Tax=Sphingobium sp. KCTC 72723 TaxID=2733867 RepID=UPI00165E9E4E|nr:DUF4169 family protein [Sphingobium sp. KCTC 72723]
MGDVVNLTQARKARGRADKARMADANRAKFGRSKTQRLADEAAKEKQALIVDGAFRESRGEDDRQPE